MKAKHHPKSIAAAAALLISRLREQLLGHLAHTGMTLAGMKLKVDDKGAVVLQDGKVVYVDTDTGTEAVYDPEATATKIRQLNGEAQAHRVAKEAAEAKLAAFAGIEDAAAALKALETVKNLSTGELKTAAQVQEIKDAAQRTAQEAVANATRAAAEKEKQLSDENGKLTQQLHTLIIGGAFTGSKFIKERLAIPADVAQAVFGSRFAVKDGKLVALTPEGQPLYSGVRHGEHADFEESIQVFVNQYANKDMILRGSGAQGGGASQGGGSAGGKKTIKRSEFNQLSPAEQMKASQEVAKGTAVIAD